MKVLFRRYTMANLITVCRIIFSVLILPVRVFSPAFFGLYLSAGLTDMIDGAVARKTGTESRFGAKLDTVADIVFVAVCLIKLLPIMHLSVFLWVWIGFIAAIKMINIVSGYVVSKEFVSMHTVMNKVTGLLLFILPLSLAYIDVDYTGALVCAVGTFAAIQEGHLIRTGRASQE